MIANAQVGSGDNTNLRIARRPPPPLPQNVASPENHQTDPFVNDLLLRLRLGPNQSHACPRR